MQSWLPYFELLLSNSAVVWVEKLEDMGDEVSAAEIVGSQCSEQHILSFAAYLEGNKSQLLVIYETLLKSL